METDEIKELLSLLESQYADLVIEGADAETLAQTWRLIKHYRSMLESPLDNSGQSRG